MSKLLCGLILICMGQLSIADEIVLSAGSTIEIKPSAITTVTCDSGDVSTNKCTITAGCKGCHTSLNFVVRNEDGSAIVATRTFSEATDVLQELVSKKICD